MSTVGFGGGSLGKERPAKRTGDEKSSGLRSTVGSGRGAATRIVEPFGQRVVGQPFLFDRLDIFVWTECADSDISSGWRYSSDRVIVRTGLSCGQGYSTDRERPPGRTGK